MLQKPNVLPLPCLLGEKPLYVNTKQYELFLNPTISIEFIQDSIEF